MVFDKMEHLESNGFFSATWLVKCGERVGLWPEHEGNRDREFVVWINDLQEFSVYANLAALTRATFVVDNIVIRPCHYSENGITVHYIDQNDDLTPGRTFMGGKIEVDTGNFVTIWNTKSLMGIAVAAHQGWDAVEKFYQDNESTRGDNIGSFCYPHWWADGHQYNSALERIGL